MQLAEGENLKIGNIIIFSHYQHGPLGRLGYGGVRAGGREQPAPEDRGRPDACPRDAIGRYQARSQTAKRSAANASRSDRKRDIIDAVRQDWQVTIRGVFPALHFD
jgi:hypothetical protein